MPKTLVVTSWNINSVRLRIASVVRFLDEVRPDFLCLQETKTPDDAFPASAFTKAGYPHHAFIGMKGYNGVAILGREPFRKLEAREMCGKPDARHIAIEIGAGVGAIQLHNFYVPAGGDVADPDENPKFAHKLSFVEELRQFSEKLRASQPRAVLVGDLNIAPLEHDVWSHKQLLDVVSHTPVETESLKAVLQEGEWCDAFRVLKPEPEKLYSWWSYRSPDWAAANKGRRLDHIWLGRGLKDQIVSGDIRKETRSWERPSDHVPITLTIARD
jgi:exodeoxyribonuclease III